MRQLRFYIPFLLSIDQQYKLPENIARHMVRVLRLTEGDEVVLFNGDNNEYSARLIEVSKKSVSVSVVSKVMVNRESKLTTHLIQSLSKGDKMETTIQKVVELGISVISPVNSERSNVSLSGERLEKKTLHWKGVIQSACEQTGRNKIPELHPLSALRGTLDAYRENLALKLLLSPHAQSCLAEIKDSPQNVIILVGPEGGLSEAEIAYALDCGFVATKAGPRVMRTETAGPAILSIVQMLWGDLG
ncbi:MAG: 16S rRNA (uracil(1498)-N(3))-methyltransferase [Gammaproteobacteria bacterium]|nr:16S rRNA (uracil(1498)-N(3))-methyltransferase [Gammaproteobacteria bacterium]